MCYKKTYPLSFIGWHHTRIRGRVADVLTIFTPYSHIHTIFTYSHHIRRRFAARFHVFTHIHTHSYPFTLVNVRKEQLSIVVLVAEDGATIQESRPTIYWKLGLGTTKGTLVGTLVVFTFTRIDTIN